MELRFLGGNDICKQGIVMHNYTNSSISLNITVIHLKLNTCEMVTPHDVRHQVTLSFDNPLCPIQYRREV